MICSIIGLVFVVYVLVKLLISLWRGFYTCFLARWLGFTVDFKKMGRMGRDHRSVGWQSAERMRKSWRRGDLMWCSSAGRWRNSRKLPAKSRKHTKSRPRSSLQTSPGATRSTRS
uniref:Putative 17 beta-hydroxysteroid dehydrogenase n=1 Tax=Ixodes ricinus TaxID=34613 RepID=V5H7G1_IXORI